MSTSTLPGSPKRRAAGTADGRGQRRSVTLGGTRVDLMHGSEAVDLIVGRAHRGASPLAVVSANLDHLHHFGKGGRWHGILEHAEAAGAVDVLTLLDGAPLVHRAQQMTGVAWPRLAGSDLIDPILDAAERSGASVGFLGGTPQTLVQLRADLSVRRPALRIAGSWSPPRAALTDPAASVLLAEDIRAAGVDILVVGLGKPRQELWIAEYGLATGAKAMLAFGAVVDFLAGRIVRAPEWMARAGLEWAHRLALEPRRLAGRYLVDGPEAYLRLQRHSRAHDGDRQPVVPADDELVDLTVLVSGASAPRARAAERLRSAAGPLSLRVIQAPTEPTAGAIDRALSAAGPTRAALILGAGGDLEPGAIPLLWKRLWHDGVGAVVPRVVDREGRAVRSLGFETRLLRVVGDRVLGSRLEHRPCWLTAVDRDTESYQYAHPVHAATTECVMVRRDALAGAAAIRVPGPRRAGAPLVARVRTAGWTVWFEPGAVVGPSSMTITAADVPKGSIVIPAHNEQAVIGRTLSRLRPVLDSGQVEVIVVCNGCEDGTADVARSHAGVEVIEIPEASKAAALNAADAAAALWPRLYLDADIEIAPATLGAMFEALDDLEPRAARAPYRYDVTGAGPLVRSYYRARSRLPVEPADLWGAGAFALNEAAHGIVRRFPEVVADDLYVGAVLPCDSKVAVAGEPVLVRTPRTVRSLSKVVRRSFRGVEELAHETGSVAPTGGRTLRELTKTVRSPLTLSDAAVYAGFAVAARISVRLRRSSVWERDDSSREQS